MLLLRTIRRLGPLLLALLLAACAADREAEPPFPQVSGPALVFFYTDN